MGLARSTGKSLYSIAAGVVLLSFSTLVGAQAPTATSTVPTLINFSGTLADANGKLLNGVVGVTFFLYKEEEGGAPLWMETQNVQPDKSGHYSVMLGSTGSQGLPQDVFVSGEARWLGVQVVGQEERPRVLLAKRKGFEQIRLADKTKLMNAPRSKRGEGRRPVMPTALEIRKEQGAHLYPAHLAKPAVNTK